MDDAEIGRLELSALKVLVQSSHDKGIGCVCCSRLNSNSRGFAGWENPKRKLDLEPIRVKRKKNGSEGQKPTVPKSKSQKLRLAKQQDNCNGYFCNYKSRGQHIENYRKEFSTVKLACPEENCISMKNQTLDKIIDPYFPNKADHRYLYNRLSLLKTLSEFYNTGVSPRDFCRQACLPPVTMGDTKARMKSITKVDAKDVENSASDLPYYLDECQISDSSPLDLAGLNRVKSAIIDTEHCEPITDDAETLMGATRSASICNPPNGLYGSTDPLQPKTLRKKHIADVKKPSQKIIDGLSNSLKEQLNVLRSGIDLKRPNYPFQINGDRLVHLKQSQTKNDVRIKEKTVSSIPKAQKGKTLYISILGRNPLNKSLHDT